uniref:68MP protein n=1 Tax=Terrapene triunguis TaxID=2587831 RepID=A0A674JPA5_9SAUR
MLKYLTKTWNTMRIYYTTVYQEIWVGLALTGYVYYRLSFGGKLHCFNLSFSVLCLKPLL